VIDARLKQTERSEAFHLVTGAGFNSAAFTWEEKRDHESFRLAMGGGDEVGVSILRHNPTDYYMRFGAFGNEFSPGVNTRVEYDRHDGTWNARIRSCSTWLRELRTEVEAPDLWASVGQERALANAAASERMNNNPFTATEKEYIFGSLEEIKATLLSMQQFDIRQAAIVDGQFQYLGEAVNRMGKKDWLNLTFSNLVTVIVGLSLTQAQGSALLRLAGTLLHQPWDGMLALGQ
jgi:hypothetical protein